jgi:hypothetical protein
VINMLWQASHGMFNQSLPFTIPGRYRTVSATSDYGITGRDTGYQLVVIQS